MLPFLPKWEREQTKWRKPARFLKFYRTEVSPPIQRMNLRHRHSYIPKPSLPTPAILKLLGQWKAFTHFSLILVMRKKIIYMMKLIRKLTISDAHGLIHMIAPAPPTITRGKFPCSSVKFQMEVWSEVQGGWSLGKVRDTLAWGFLRKVK